MPRIRGLNYKDNQSESPREITTANNEEIPQFVENGKKIAHLEKERKLKIGEPSHSNKW